MVHQSNLTSTSSSFSTRPFINQPSTKEQTFNLIDQLGSHLINYYHPTLIDSSSPSKDKCHFEHDPTSLALSIFILIGMLISYLPQHYRIISSKSSQGISSWFLLLGSTSSTSSLVNAITLQWGVVRCCQVLTPGQCAESLLGIVQVFVQWACFNLILILSLIYFPPNEKYVRVVPVEARDRTPSRLDLATSYSSQFLSRFFLKAHHSSKRRKRQDPLGREGSKQRISARPSSESLSSQSSSDSSASVSSSDSSSFDPSNVLPPSATRFSPLTLSKEYTVSLVLALVVLIHFIFSAFITLCILLLLPKATIGEPSGTPPSHSGEHPTTRLLRIWASCSGILSMLLAGCQYLPQIYETFQLKLVGSLSIPMMILQTPGSFLFVYSLAIRPGLNWTTWIVYLVTGILQGILLILCVCWKVRQQANGIDDWGQPMVGGTSSAKKPRRGDRISPRLSSSRTNESEDEFNPTGFVVSSERTPLINSTRSHPS